MLTVVIKGPQRSGKTKLADKLEGILLPDGARIYRDREPGMAPSKSTLEAIEQRGYTHAIFEVQQ